MDIKKNLPDGFEVIVDEWGAASHGFYNTEECPALMFREKSDYAAYFGKMISAFVSENIPVSKMLICLSGQHEMTTDFSGFRNFFTLNFIKKPIYNAFVVSSKLGDNLLAFDGERENMSVLPTSDGKGRVAVMLSYASENFDEELPDVSETLSFMGITGKRLVRVWCIDKLNTNPYELAIREKIGKEPTEEQVSRLREEGLLKPVCEFEQNFDENQSVVVDFTDNALVMVEIV